jgi:hypothetical protein
MDEDFYLNAARRSAHELEAELTTDIEWWSDEPLGVAIEKAVRQLVHEVDTLQWHLFEALSQELVARLEAAEAAGRMDESAVTHYQVRLVGLRGHVEKVVEHAERQRQAGAIVRELLDG